MCCEREMFQISTRTTNALNEWLQNYQNPAAFGVALSSRGWSTPTRRFYFPWMNDSTFTPCGKFEWESMQLFWLLIFRLNEKSAPKIASLMFANHASSHYCWLSLCAIRDVKQTCFIRLPTCPCVYTFPSFALNIDLYSVSGSKHFFRRNRELLRLNHKWPIRIQAWDRCFVWQGALTTGTAGRWFDWRLMTTSTTAVSLRQAVLSHSAGPKNNGFSTVTFQNPRPKGNSRSWDLNRGTSDLCWTEIILNSK